LTSLSLSPSPFLSPSPSPSLPPSLSLSLSLSLPLSLPPPSLPHARTHARAHTQVRDLLSKDPKNKLELKEDPDRGVYVKDLTSYVVKVL
jgi:hypothetical protein